MIMNALTSLLVKPIMELIDVGLFSSTFTNIFFIERQFGISENIIMAINVVILSFSGSILTIKLLHKLFSVYILKKEGDATTSVLDYVKNYCLGIGISLTFTVAYQWLGTVMQELQAGISSVLGTGEYNFDLTNLAFSSGLFIIIYVIFVAVVYVNFLINGVRMLILRLGMPFACVGLIDGEKGFYGIFIKKIFQTAITVLVQIVLVQLSTLPLLAGNKAISILSGIAILAYSMKISTDLNEIFLANASSGMGQKASSAVMGIRNVAGMLFKGGK